MWLYADADGRLMRVCKTEGELAQYGAPEAYADSLVIDPETNPMIASRIDTAWNDTRLVGGVLSYKGQAVTISPPGAAWKTRADTEDARARILAAIDRALADYDAALAQWATLTAAKQKVVLKRLVEVQVQLLRYHRRELL